jgi:hypothetical protein
MSWTETPIIKWLHQTKKYKNVEFHKFEIWDDVNCCWNTYWYLDKIDIKRLTNPSKLEKRLFNIR